MHLFLTGASGWIGSAVTDELLAHGHTVSGLARSDASAAALEAKGVGIVRGSLTDLDAIRGAAEASDGVVHLGFVHDFANFAESGRIERAVVEALGETLAGSDRPLAIASGVAIPLGRPLTEADENPTSGPDAPRGGSENLALDLADQGVRSIALRFAPTVHGHRDHGFSATLAAVARRTGVSGYIGDGSNRWPAVHRTDAARLVRLAVEEAAPGTRVHVVAEEGITTRAMAEAHAAVLGLPTASIDPEDAAAHFDWIARFYGMDVPTSSAITRERFGWEPVGPTLLEDIAAGAYAAEIPDRA
ncbi:SDR family oxidoreductase [Nocardioides ultimimeridianus]